jgi:pentatricopeptide repeat protein
MENFESPFLWTDSDKLNHKAHECYLKEEYGAAMDLLEEISLRGIASPNVYFNKALVLRQQGKSNKEKIYLSTNAFLDLSEKEIYARDCLYAVGNNHVLLGDTEKAIAMYRFALEQDVGFDNSYVSMIACHCSLRRFDKAEEVYYEGINNCDSPLILGLFNMALANAYSKNYQSSRKYFSSCLKNLPELLDYSELDGLGNYFRNSDFDGFFKYLNEDSLGRKSPLWIVNPKWKEEYS